MLPELPEPMRPPPVEGRRQSSSDPLSVVDHLPAVSLDEIDALAALRARRDRKYLLGTAQLAALLARLDPRTRVLQLHGSRQFRYRSVYFDDRRRSLFLAAAHGDPQRAKVRTRTYLDSGLTLLEVKQRDARGLTVKHRFEGSAGEPAELGPAARAAVADVDRRLAGMHLEAVLVTRFSRTTLLLPHGERITIDVDLSIESTAGPAWMLPEVAIVETKSSGAPTEADAILRAARERRVRFSKYGTGMAALDLGLPSRRWRQALHCLGAPRAASRRLGRLA